MMSKGRLIGFPVTGFRVVIAMERRTRWTSDNAFQAAARGAFRAVIHRRNRRFRTDHEGLGKADRIQVAFVRTIMQRRGIIIGTTEEGFVVSIRGSAGENVWLFDRSPILVPGKAEYTMEFSRYAPVPAEVHLELVKKFGTGLVAEDEE
jgi:elongation factor G